MPGHEVQNALNLTDAGQEPLSAGAVVHLLAALGEDAVQGALCTPGVAGAVNQADGRALWHGGPALIADSEPCVLTVHCHADLHWPLVAAEVGGLIAIRREVVDVDRL